MPSNTFKPQEHHDHDWSQEEKSSDTRKHSAIAVSPVEAARMCGVGRTKLYEALGSGALKSLKLGSRRLIRIAEINAWLKRLEEAESRSRGR